MVFIGINGYGINGIVWYEEELLGEKTHSGGVTRGMNYQQGEDLYIWYLLYWLLTYWY